MQIAAPSAVLAPTSGMPALQVPKHLQPTASQPQLRLATPTAEANQAAAGVDTLKVAQMNLWNLFDTKDDPGTGDPVLSQKEYETKLAKIALAISNELGMPDLISLNEIENEDVVRDLIAMPLLRDQGYKYIVREGNDARGLNVGVMYKDSKLIAGAVDQPNPVMDFPDGGRGQLDQSLLYARAPLVVDFKFRGAAQAGEGAKTLVVAVNHFKSKLGGAAPEARRQMQGEYLGGYMDARKAADPNIASMVIGDLNANYEDGAYQRLERRKDGSQRFQDVPLSLREQDRYTYVYRGKPNMLDHMLVSDDLAKAVKSVAISHTNTTSSAKKQADNPDTHIGHSDHDPILVEFDLKKLLKG